ncbi:MAG: VWA domain-containing protein, partial [Haliea sp.]|nr:VWA domain-containing protein [Haliea sp.]
MLAWVFAAIAAAGPSLKQIPQPVEQIEDALVLVLDLSYSMKAADQAPSRIDRARQKLLDLLQEREEGQTGLVAYAGDAHVVTPLTDDTATIANLLPALNPDMMPLPGSSTSAAITLALDLLQSAGVKGGRILLVTDGIPEAEASRVRQLLQGSPNRLAILGVGTRNGAPMPLPRGGFVRDDSNAIVMPGLEEAALEDLAAATGGQYRRLQVDDRDLTALLAQLPSARQTRVDDNRSADTWEDQGYWLILALLPIALALFRRGWLLGFVPMMLPIMLPLTLLLAPAPAQADAWRNLWLTPDQQAQQALAAGDAETAAELFEDPNWKATAAYSSGDYAQAVSLFSEQETADGWYNRGNALARSGDLKGASDAYRK